MIRAMVALLVLMSSLSLAAEPRDLKTVLTMDSGVFPCNGEMVGTYYTNKTGQPIYLRQVQMWMGMVIGGRGDFWATLRRNSDGSVITFTNWDHYDEPTGPDHSIHKNFAPDYMMLADGDGVSLTGGCLTPRIGKQMIEGQIVVRAWGF